MTADRKGYHVDINYKWCKNCGICAAFCPKKALVADERGRPTFAEPEACTGCEMCVLRCPDFALTLKERKEAC